MRRPVGGREDQRVEGRGEIVHGIDLIIITGREGGDITTEQVDNE